jgi:hypothetical protein
VIPRGQILAWQQYAPWGQMTVITGLPGARTFRIPTRFLRPRLVQRPVWGAMKSSALTARGFFLNSTLIAQLRARRIAPDRLPLQGGSRS